MAVPEEASQLQEVAQLAYIAGVVIGAQHLHGVRRYAKLAMRYAGEQGLCKERNILAAVAQGRKLNGEGVEPVIEVLPEFTLGHQAAHGLMGRRNQPEIAFAYFVLLEPGDRSGLAARSSFTCMA